MPVRSLTNDPKRLTMTVVAEFPVPVERVWAAWADPRQLERFWGPPEWPATFVEHNFVVDGKSSYYMTGPNGTRSHGWWRAMEQLLAMGMDEGLKAALGQMDQVLV